MARGHGSNCNAKEGNPFGPFWDTFSVDFVGSEFYGPLNYDIHHQDMARKWNERFSPTLSPGVAITFFHFYLDYGYFVCSFINIEYVYS